MNVTKEMVDRFLCWKLPADFYPDAGISFAPGHTIAGSPLWPSGTNLLTATQAQEMLEHVLQSGDKSLQKLGVRLSELLDEDQWAECEALLLAAGVTPNAELRGRPLADGPA